MIEPSQPPGSEPLTFRSTPSAVPATTRPAHQVNAFLGFFVDFLSPFGYERSSPEWAHTPEVMMRPTDTQTLTLHSIARYTRRHSVIPASQPRTCPMSSEGSVTFWLGQLQEGDGPGTGAEPVTVVGGDLRVPPAAQQSGQRGPGPDRIVAHGRSSRPGDRRKARLRPALDPAQTEPDSQPVGTGGGL